MINSQNGVGTVLRSGESVASSAEALKDPNAKTFFHQIPGARFCMPDGLEVRFFGGRFVTTDEAIIAELNKVANKATSLIFTIKEMAATITAANNKLAADAADTAGKATK